MSGIETAIKKKIEAVGTPLKEWDLKINYGIKTGFNEAFIIDANKRSEILEKCPKAAEIIRPILLGRNIKKYFFNWEGLWLINTHNGIKSKNIKRVDVENDYPTVFEYLAQFQPQLEKRLDQGDHWSNLRNCAYFEDFKKPKIVWGNLALNVQFSFVENEDYINAPSAFISTDSLYILAILNSKLADFYIKRLGVSRNGGYFEYKPMFIEQLPVPTINLEAQTPFKSLAEEVLRKKKEGLAIDYLEIKINELVYQLYGLSPEEGEFIDKLL